THPPEPQYIDRTYCSYQIDVINGEPTDAECVALARAILHAGAHVNQLAGHGADLVPWFLGRYTADAIDARSRGVRELGRDDVARAHQFGEINQSSGGGNNEAVIGSSLGAAFRATTEYLDHVAAAGEALPDAALHAQYERRNRIRNAALTMRGVLDGME